LKNLNGLKTQIFFSFKKIIFSPKSGGIFSRPFFFSCGLVIN